MLQSPDAGLPDKISEQKLPFMRVRPNEELRVSRATPSPKSKTVEENMIHQDSKGKNIHDAHIPRKSLLSTGEHSSNMSRLGKKASSSEVIARLNSLPIIKGPTSLELLRERLVSLNKEEKILNSDKFPPLASNDIILIVQVHKRLGYLKQLLDSLRAARDIDKVLLVVSHDYYYDEMNQLVETVDFCKVSCLVCVY